MSAAGRHEAGRGSSASPGTGRTASSARATTRRSRAGRTLVALLGVSSIAFTAAAAQPVDPGERTRPGEVFALGADGLGSLDLLVADEGGADPDRSRTRDPSGRERPGAGPGLGAGAVPGAGPGGAVEVPVLPGEILAAIVPAGFGGGTGIPAPTLRAYRAAAEVLGREAPGCRIDWALLAGIGRVEANHGRFGGASVSDQGVSVPRILGPRLDGTLAGTQVIRDTDGGALDGDAAYDRAVGPMQFLPGTWRRWGSDGDRDGTSNPQDIDDAALAAARYLCEGRDGLDGPAQAALAVRRYNNSSSYVDLVLDTASGYRTGGPGSPGDGQVPFGEDPFGDGGYVAPFTPVGATPPGWTPPPGTVVGAGPSRPSATASPTPTRSPVTPTASPSAPPSPTSRPTVPPSGNPSGPTSAPSGTPSQGPSQGPSQQPSGEPSGGPTTVTPSPTDPSVDPTPTCEPTPSATGPSPTASGPEQVQPSQEATVGPCPLPCGATPSPSVEPTAATLAPGPAPSCLPVPSGSPTP